MDPMNKFTVIAFYPGGGGNRLRRYFENQKFDSIDCSYDQQYKDQTIENRYLISVASIPDSEFVLTHCLNYLHIVDVLSPKKVVMIKTDFKKSLQREWILHGATRYTHNQIKDKDKEFLTIYNSIKDTSWPECTNIDSILPAHKAEVIEHMKKFKYRPEVESSWETIKWHHNYYNTYPVEVGNAELIDNNNFTNVIETELNRYNNEIFNFCWDTYVNHGPGAPIIELYNDKQK